MANDPTNPLVGERHIDASELDFLVDVEPSALQGLLTAQANFAEVQKEVDGHVAAWGEAAGLPAGDVARLSVLNQRIARIDAFLAPAKKLAEMLHETRCLLEDERQHIILDLGAAVERRGKKKPELLAKFAETRAYRSAAGKKAAKTRKKNAAAAEAPEAPPDTETGHDG